MIQARWLLVLSTLITLFVARAHALADYDFVVSKDSSGNFRTIQEAVNACRDYAEKQYVIFVKNGVYEEKLVIPTWKTHITIIGQNVDSTVVTYNDYSGKIDNTGKRLNTFTSFTCQVAGNNIVFDNITFINSAGRVGQAVAMHVEGDRCVFRNCSSSGIKIHCLHQVSMRGNILTDASSRGQPISFLVLRQQSSIDASS
jgi:pectinesterase